MLKGCYTGFAEWCQIWYREAEMVLQGWERCVTEILKSCYSGVHIVLEGGVTRLLQGGVQGCNIGFTGSYRFCTWVLQECYSSVERVLPPCKIDPFAKRSQIICDQS